MYSGEETGPVTCNIQENPMKSEVLQTIKTQYISFFIWSIHRPRMFVYEYDSIGFISIPTMIIAHCIIFGLFTAHV